MTYFIEFFSTIMAVMVIGKSYADYKKGSEALVVFLFWALAWLVIVFIAYFPQTIDLISQRLDGQGSGVARVLGLGLTFLFFVIYRVFVKAERIERKIGLLIQRLAIKESFEPHKRKTK